MPALLVGIATLIARQAKLFDMPPAPRMFRAHVFDAGDKVMFFRCQRCGWDSGWIDWDNGVSAAKKGIPCPRCNAGHEQRDASPRLEA